jgi:hypothetical protein
MSADSRVPMVRCHLEGGDGDPALALRFIPAAEFELWRHFMETRHSLTVTVEDVSVWVPETSEGWSEDLDPDALLPVVRVRYEKPGPQDSVVPVERLLLAHADPGCGRRLEATPGYFVPAQSRPRTLDTDFVLG